MQNAQCVHSLRLRVVLTPPPLEGEAPAQCACFILHVPIKHTSRLPNSDNHSVQQSVPRDDEQDARTQST